MIFERLLVRSSVTILYHISDKIQVKRSFFGISSFQTIPFSPSVKRLIRHFSVKMASSETHHKHTNRLINEKSPYLLQHAHNPVNWFPWGTEAFEKSKKENKLIFLSVGYSTCHWCHVMERESFENEDIAKIMNEHFVCVKVDREERPDVDKIYMTFVQATAGRGGWPMSVWLTPELQAIYGGTYYPPQDRYGMPGFATLLLSLSKQWRDKRDSFVESGRQIMEALKEASSLDEESGNPLSENCTTKCFQQLEKSFEPRYGGFSSSPKFPQPVNMNFLLNLWARDKSSSTGKKALDMVSYTLEKMAKGGIHDHVSQGFARYSTDNKWHVPHFEKMLYDQGQLAVCYANAYVATNNALFAEMVRDIMIYVFRDLSHPLGGFYSAEDADSYPDEKSTEKREGAFCVWTFKEIHQYLEKPLAEKTDLHYADVFGFHFNVQPNGNVSPAQDPHKELANQNVLINFGSELETATHFSLTLEETQRILKECCDILYQVRKQRPRPHLDDKMITAWNGLMISGIAKAGQILNDSSYVDRAVKAARFVRKYLYSEEDKTLLRSCYNGGPELVTQIDTPIHGFLDDYAFLIRGILDVYEASFDSAWLTWANTLQETQNNIFWDDKDGGYYGSPSGDPSLILRLKEDQDGAEPSGNSVSVHNLLRLSGFLDNLEYKEKAERILKTFSSRLNHVPFALPEMISGLMIFNDSPTQIFIIGQPQSADTKGLLNVVNSRLIPGRVLAIADTVLCEKNEILRGMKAVDGKATAYVCRQRVCSLPVNTPDGLASLLDGK